MENTVGVQLYLISCRVTESLGAHPVSQKCKNVKCALGQACTEPNMKYTVANTWWLIAQYLLGSKRSRRLKAAHLSSSRVSVTCSSLANDFDPNPVNAVSNCLWCPWTAVCSFRCLVCAYDQHIFSIDLYCVSITVNCDGYCLSWT